MERIRELIEELYAATRELFPEMTEGSVTFYADGYRNINVTKWDKNEGKPVKDRKYKNLADQARVNGVWLHDRSEDQNTYLKSVGQLLGGED